MPPADAASEQRLMVPVNGDICFSCVVSSVGAEGEKITSLLIILSGRPQRDYRAHVSRPQAQAAAYPQE